MKTRCINRSQKLKDFHTKSRTYLYNTYKTNIVTVENCLELLDRGHIQAGQALYLGTKNIKNKDAAKILAPFGFTDRPKNTKEMRKVVLNYVLNNKTLLFEIINISLTNKITHSSNIRIVTTKCAKWFLICLNKLDYKYNCTGKDTTIKYGSFYINNKWIHVG